MTEQPAPITQPSLMVTLLPTKHLGSNTLLSPIWHASTVQSTSKTLFEPIISAGVVVLSALSNGTLKIINVKRHSEGNVKNETM